MSSLMSSIAEYLPAAGFVAVPFIGGFLSGFRDSENSSSELWHNSLKFPRYRPPNWVFAPVWSCIFTCMGTASYLIWREGGFEEQCLPLAVYGGQLLLGWAWTPLFYRQRRIGMALIDMVALWGSIAASIGLFYPVNRTAAYLLLPHLGWITFATVLNFDIWRLNRNNNTKKD